MAQIPVYSGPGTASAATQLYVAASSGWVSVGGVAVEVTAGVTCIIGGAVDAIYAAAPTGMFTPLLVQIGEQGGPT